jgi:L-ascorbate metabolism protein UlaG (beta-lactamase superfamily)
MKITKLGHCCFIAEPKDGVRIMTDPGAFSSLQNSARNISIVLITHEHADHLHIASLEKVLENNPSAKVVTNSSVGKLLDTAQIPYIKVEYGESFGIDGVQIKAFGNSHAEIYGEYGRVQNTGYMINNLCYPGDSFTNPNQKVDILALPVAGPWMKMQNAIDYAKEVNPRIAFPVHDAIVQDFATFVWRIPEHFLGELGILWKKLEIAKEEEL